MSSRGETVPVESGRTARPYPGGGWAAAYPPLGENGIGIDYLINNAGIVDDLTEVFQTNLVGPACLRVAAQALLPLVAKSAKKTIVNISSTLGSIGTDLGQPKFASYAVTKAGLNMLTSKQAKPRPDIVAVAICPQGHLQTDRYYYVGAHVRTLPEIRAPGHTLH
ncbi:hypothetical protein LXA43DRAFT_1181400 [Ganoderma leucocontextum]|nr:hypothetical protein LXA43DRAFT_1181400 [Ganoderma leucocontextum]